MNVRKVISASLAFVGGLATVFGLVLLIAQHSLFDTGAVRATTEKVVADPDVTRLLTREISDRVIELGGLEAQRTQVEGVVELLLSDPNLKGEVTDSVLASYDELVNGNDATIVFNMPGRAKSIRNQAVRFFPDLDNTLPPADELLKFDLFERDSLPGLYSTVEAMRGAAIVIFIAGLVLIATALVLGPGRFGMFAWAAAVVTAGTFLAVTLITSGADSALDKVKDPLSRRVARLASDSYLNDLNDIALGVVIFGLIAFIAGLGGSWIRTSLFPPRPKPARG